MAKVIEPAKSGTRSIRGLIRKDIERTLTLAHPRGRSLSDRSVHDIRRNLKRLRATLRLVRSEIGAREFRTENRAFRDAARPLISVRDATVLVDALEKLVRHYRDRLRPAEVKRLRKALRGERQAMKAKILSNPQLERGLIVRLETMHRRVEDLSIGKHGWSVLGAGIRRTYKEARRSYRRAHESRTDEDLHECRKQIKYLYFQLHALQPIWPGVLSTFAGKAKDLTDYLGDDHDLALLERRLATHREWLPDRREFLKITKLIHERRGELQGRAFAVGDRLMLERPRDFAAKLESYWDTWRAERARPSR